MKFIVGNLHLIGGGEGGEDPEPFAAALLPRGVQGDLKGAKAKNRIS